MKLLLLTLFLSISLVEGQAADRDDALARRISNATTTLHGLTPIIGIQNKDEFQVYHLHTDPIRIQEAVVPAGVIREMHSIHLLSPGDTYVRTDEGALLSNKHVAFLDDQTFDHPSIQRIGNQSSIIIGGKTKNQSQHNYEFCRYDFDVPTKLNMTRIYKAMHQDPNLVHHRALDNGAVLLFEKHGYRGMSGFPFSKLGFFAPNGYRTWMVNSNAFFDYVCVNGRDTLLHLYLEKSGPENSQLLFVYGNGSMQKTKKPFDIEAMIPLDDNNVLLKSSTTPTRLAVLNKNGDDTGLPMKEIPITFNVQGRTSPLRNGHIVLWGIDRKGDNNHLKIAMLQSGCLLQDIPTNLTKIYKAVVCQGDHIAIHGSTGKGSEVVLIDKQGRVVRQYKTTVGSHFMRNDPGNIFLFNDGSLFLSNGYCFTTPDLDVNKVSPKWVFLHDSKEESFSPNLTQFRVELWHPIHQLNGNQLIIGGQQLLEKSIPECTFLIDRTNGVQKQHVFQGRYVPIMQ